MQVMCSLTSIKLHVAFILKLHVVDPCFSYTATWTSGLLLGLLDSCNSSSSSSFFEFWYMGSTIQFQLIFTFIYSIFSKKFSISVKYANPKKTLSSRISTQWFINHSRSILMLKLRFNSHCMNKVLESLREKWFDLRN